MKENERNMQLLRINLIIARDFMLNKDQGKYNFKRHNFFKN